MPRHFYAIVIAFLCGYAVATLNESSAPPAEREVPDRHPVDERTALAGQRPPDPVVEPPAAADATRGGRDDVSAPRSRLTRECTVTGIVLSHQGDHMIRCEPIDASEASLLVEIDRTETDLVAKLAPGDIIVTTGSVVEESYGTLRLDEGRISHQR